MTRYIKEETPASAWEHIVRTILTEGKPVKDERGSNTLEITNLITEIKNPYDPTHPKNCFWTGEKLHKYEEQFFSADNDQGFIYTYGNRFNGYFGPVEVDASGNLYTCYTVNQIECAIHRLRECGESRRAISVTWDPTADVKRDEVPCLILIDYKIRNGKLLTTALWRSHDIYGAYYPNLRGLIYTSKYVAKELKTKLGPMTIHSISAHIYENDMDSAKGV